MYTNTRINAPLVFTTNVKRTRLHRGMHFSTSRLSFSAASNIGVSRIIGQLYIHFCNRREREKDCGRERGLRIIRRRRNSGRKPEPRKRALGKWVTARSLDGTCKFKYPFPPPPPFSSFFLSLFFFLPLLFPRRHTRAEVRALVSRWRAILKTAQNPKPTHRKMRKRIVARGDCE